MKLPDLIFKLQEIAKVEGDINICVLKAQAWQDITEVTVEEEKYDDGEPAFRTVVIKSELLDSFSTKDGMV